MAIRKTFSFSEEIAAWIDSHGKSKYLSGLVLEDMNSEGFITKGEVIRLIEERIKSSVVIDKMDEEFKKNALGLLKF